MGKSDGGPAFPGQMPTGYDPRSGNFNEGMSLRDYFAAQAMLAHVQLCQLVATLWAADKMENVRIDQSPAVIARGAYEIADAMLAERQKAATP